MLHLQTLLLNWFQIGRGDKIIGYLFCDQVPFKPNDKGFLALNHKFTEYDISKDSISWHKLVQKCKIGRHRVNKKTESVSIDSNLLMLYSDFQRLAFENNKELIFIFQPNQFSCYAHNLPNSIYLGDGIDCQDYFTPDMWWDLKHLNHKGARWNTTRFAEKSKER